MQSRNITKRQEQSINNTKKNRTKTETIPKKNTLMGRKGENAVRSL